MQIRPAIPGDLEQLTDIDGTITSLNYLHVEKTGEGFAQTWKIEERPLRSKLIEPNALDDETRFAMKQIVNGIEEGLALVAEHDGVVAATLIAQRQPSNSTFRLLDLRVDHDQRGQGVGSAMLFQSIQQARELGLRAISAQTKTNNVSAANFLIKRGFDLAGLDTHLHSNHDLVKESVTLFWYAALT
ncbi:MAG TPA: GNAT family N-acetyltransferase [Tepidisphaeraceae bacterium]|jgi:N-acetylglutamate synthase-like GNAT family acetyltransferase|nr:GNAT family N-acetyltransferase [Tepidisphaeraceae bacterium]